MTPRIGIVPKVITFDFYGTLVQWHEGLHDVATELLRRKTSNVSADELMKEFHGVGKKLRDTPPYKPYREVLRESLRQALVRFQLSFEDRDYDTLIKRVYNLPPFPEVTDVL